MFQKDEYIVYGITGVCKVADVTTLDMDGVAKDRLYYILEPVSAGGKIYIPVDSDKTIMRRILSKEEAKELIDDAPNVGNLWVPDDKLREMKYKEALKGCDCREYIKIINTLFLRKQERIIQGKKTCAMDDRYQKMAEEALYSELSIPLGIPKAEMGEYIADKMKEFAE